MDVNIKGITAIVLIGLMALSCFLQEWDVPWFFVGVTTFAFIVFVLDISEKMEIFEINFSSDPRTIMGGYLSYLLCAAAMFLSVRGFFAWTGIGIAAVFSGFSIPFLILSKSR